jgi:hypothetical protein
VPEHNTKPTFTADMRWIWNLRKHRQKLLPRRYKLPVRRSGLSDIPDLREPGRHFPVGGLQRIEPSELQHPNWINRGNTRRHNRRSRGPHIGNLRPSLNNAQPGQGLPGIGKDNLLNHNPSPKRWNERSWSLCARANCVVDQLSILLPNTVI